MSKRCESLVPLITRSHYSLMRGTAAPREICRTARRLGYDRLALTDTDNLCGFWPFLDARGPYLISGKVESDRGATSLVAERPGARPTSAALSPGGIATPISHWRRPRRNWPTA